MMLKKPKASFDEFTANYLDYIIMLMLNNLLKKEKTSFYCFRQGRLHVT